MRTSLNITLPVYKPVSLAECKETLNLMDSDDRHDEKIGRMLAAATTAAENFTGQMFAQRAVTINYSSFDEYVRLPVHPVQSVTSIKYYDSDDVLQTVSTADYDVDLSDKPPIVRFINLPSMQDLLIAGQIIVLAGYESGHSPATRDRIPEDIRQAILFRVVQDFQTSGELSSEAIRTFRNMLQPYEALKL